MPSSFDVTQKPASNIYDVVTTADAFSIKDCRRIVETYGVRPFEIAKVHDGDERLAERSSQIQFVQPDEYSTWIFQVLGSVVAYVNEKSFNFNIAQFREGFQFTQYGVGDHYGWHVDIGLCERQERKLSIVLQLNEDYEGGDLEFFPSRYKVPKQAGLLALFPAFLPHRVTPVTSGVRHSLVSWVAGNKPFA